ncbi:MAG: DUF1697 domain-containing protein [Chloroflexi bacterium]|nr:MAG: DUF1697 domain-containing protein [Chloroflexota bacterium]
MAKYVALLRGINVGGKSLIKMSDLKLSMERAGYESVRTYINSGNVFFESKIADTSSLASAIESLLLDDFTLNAKVVVLNKSDIDQLQASIPRDWGAKPDWKYNTLFMLRPGMESHVLQQVGELQSDIEILIAAKGVVFQAIEFAQFSKARSGKLASLPIYRDMTVRNFNTTKKIIELF